MSIVDFNFKVHNFNFSKNSYKKVRQIAELIYLGSPSESHLDIQMQAVSEGIRATARLVSLSGIYECSSVDRDPVEAMALLREKMNDYFDFWRRSRCLDETQAG